IITVVIFFFSSRRRHTRFSRDWSSDVCSSDLWPRTVQQPHPPVWIPLTGSKESIEWAAKHDATITPGVFPGPMREDTIRYFAKCQAQYGRKVDPNKISIMVDCYVADSKEQAVEEYGEHLMYLFNT